MVSHIIDYVIVDVVVEGSTLGKNITFILISKDNSDKLGLFLAFLAIAVQNPKGLLARNSESEHLVRNLLGPHSDSNRTKLGLGMQLWQ